MNRFSDQNPTNGVETGTRLGDLAAQAFDKHLRLLRLSEMWERKTELEDLFECFYTEVSPLLDFDGLEYVSPGFIECVRFGRMRQIRTPFELNFGGNSLGTLRMHSARVMSARDHRAMEELLPGFMYPLSAALEKRAETLASWIDPFTGMNNRLALEQLLPREMTLSRDEGEPLSLLTIDLDHFKKINGIHGHEVGDQIILAVADALTANLRGTDIIFRLESDRFVVILGATDFDDATMVSERLRTCVDTSFTYQNVQVVQSASAGVTEMVDNDTAESLTERAEAALVNAKRAGRNRIRFLAASEHA